MTSITKDVVADDVGNAEPTQPLNAVLREWARLYDDKPPSEWWDSDDDPFAAEASR